MNTPLDIVRYILNNNLEADFLNSMMMHKGSYTIAEIADREYVQNSAGFRLKSATYSINVKIEDDDVLTALHNGLYVTAFISRQDDSYQVHFLVHQYPQYMKSDFDDNIAEEVVQYMILKTVLALRLDTEKKVDDYCSNN